MKRFLYIFTAVVLLSSCSKLTDVLDNNPPNNLVPENVAPDADGLKRLLNGTYATLHDQYYNLHSEIIPSVLGGTMRRVSMPTIHYQDNAVTPDVAMLNAMWMAYYKLVNMSNWVIKLAGELPEGEMSVEQKTLMIAEARALRAMGHFDALRYFGQYYDSNSKYGVVVRTDAIDFTTRHIKRSTVAETYAQIIDDLDFAIANGPEFSKPIFMSKTAAKALKARVLLYKGDYSEAAALADQVITENKRTLSPTFAAVFSTGFNSTEMIFMKATDAVTAVLERKKNTYPNGATTGSPWLKTFMTGDPRAALTFNATNNYVLKVNNQTFFAPTYFIRLAEMYLIKAEALTRSDAPLADAKLPLQAIRSRAFGTPQVSLATTKEALLDEIHAEIIKELVFENGSDWFASVRFDKIKTIKPSVTSVNQYILPIPESETLTNNLFGPQNPGYE